MRLIDTMKDPQLARNFSSYLTKIGIKNELEQSRDGVLFWIIDEDDLKTATEQLEKFRGNPHDTQFDTGVVPQFTIPMVRDDEDPQNVIEIPVDEKTAPQPYATLCFLFVCIILFAASYLTTPTRQYVNVPYPQVAIYSSEVTEGLLFDFPKGYEILKKVVDTYGINALKDPSSMPASGQALLQEYSKTPTWQGFYEDIVLIAKGKSSELPATTPPMFEKIREGEVWRLFTPALLHLDIFHLLFNMLWLVVLGRQIELHIGAWKYVLFCVIVGVFSNVVQYLISGPNFIGFSGILCGFFTFIWVRQKQAPWEGYRLDKSTIMMIGIFVGAIFLIQVASFIAEVYANTSIAPMIANAAHISGGVAGWVLGKNKFFAWKNN